MNNKPKKTVTRCKDCGHYIRADMVYCVECNANNTNEQIKSYNNWRDGFNKNLKEKIPLPKWLKK